MRRCLDTIHQSNYSCWTLTTLRTPNSRESRLAIRFVIDLSKWEGPWIRDISWKRLGGHYLLSEPFISRECWLAIRWLINLRKPLQLISSGFHSTQRCSSMFLTGELSKLYPPWCISCKICVLSHWQILHRSSWGGEEKTAPPEGAKILLLFSLFYYVVGRTYWS